METKYLRIGNTFWKWLSVTKIMRQVNDLSWTLFIVFLGEFIGKVMVFADDP
jgi:hypothetical protein